MNFVVANMLGIQLLSLCYFFGLIIEEHDSVKFICLSKTVILADFRAF